MTPIEKLISLAEQEVGYCEKSAAAYKQNPAVLDDKTAGAGDSNYTKYGRDMVKWVGAPYAQGVAWCFTEGTMVLTSNGYIPIEDLKIGDKVLNAYGNSFNTVVDTKTRMSKVCRIRAYGMPNLVTTPEHPFLSNKRLGVRKDWKHTKLDFNPISELKHGDNVIIPCIDIVNDIDLTYDEAWVIGYFVGDGWKTSRNAYRLCGNKKKEIEIYKHIKTITKDKDYASRTCYEYQIDKEKNKRILNILDEVGCGASNKVVPASILFANIEIKKAFLDGYLTADGTKDGKFNTTSKKLAYGLVKIVFDLGYGCSLLETVRKEEQDIFDKRINAYRKIHIKPIIYCGAINKNQRKANRMDRLVDNLVYTPLKYCQPLEVESLVYNITTDGDHTYLANNLAVHNCDMFVDHCFIAAFGLSKAKEMLGGWSAYTPTSAQYYKNMGRWSNTPEVGAQIFFKNDTRICHTGLVYKVDSTHVYTIEGNTSSASGVVANGGCVAKKSYLRTNSRIAGYGMPRYELVQTKQYLYKGIDVSAYQTSLNYEAIKKAGIDFAILKIVRKDMNKDKMFEKHYEQFTNVKIPIFAVYQYSYAQTVDKAKKDAQTVIKALEGRRIAVCLDVEDDVQKVLGPTLIDIINVYQAEIEKAGLPFLLYTGMNFYNTYIRPYESKLKCKDLWIARYYKSYTPMAFAEDPSQNYKPFSNLVGWQYTSSGQIPGNNGNLDFDIIYRDISSPTVTGQGIVTKVTTNGGKLNVRNAPKIGAIVDRLSNGTEVKIIGVKDEWPMIGPDKYVSPMYISTNTYGTIIANALNIRNADSTKGRILGQFHKNEVVTILAQSATGWYLTPKGWISNNYVKI